MTRFVESTITFPYKRSLGPVVGAFMTALTEKQILGIRCGDAVLVPPMEWDPATGRIKGDEEANQLLRRPYRAPWVHPAVS